MYFVNKYEPELQVFTHDENELDNHEVLHDDQNSSQKIKYILTGLIAVSLCTHCAVDSSHSGYSPTYFQYLSTEISAQKAAHILSVYSGCHALGRLISIIESMKVSTTTMITIHSGLTYFAQFLLFFGGDNESIIWTGNILLGIYS